MINVVRIHHNQGASVVDIEDGDDEPAASEPEDEENDEIDESDVDTVANHKEQLEKLKRQDPEFYKYLEENDKQLLDFGESDEDGDDNEEGDGEEAEEQAGDEGDEEMDESIVITAETIQTWKSQLAKNSLAAVRKTLLGFRAACAMGDVDGDDNHAFSYKIEDSAVYSSMVVTCIKYVPNVIKNHLIPKSEEGKENVSVSKSPKWKKLKPFVKSYASNLVRLLKQMTDVAMVRFVVRESENAISFFTAFPKLGKEYLKLLAKLWADANEKIKVVAFLCIRKLAVSNPQPYLELSLKGTYLHYMEAARMTNRVTWNNLAFMSSCITELASLHPPTTYQLVFLYIRQLAMLLRSALMSATKESFKKVVNWQFVRCISVWSKTLGSLCHTERAKDETAEMLRPLIYPLVQIGLGSMRIKPSAKFFAFRFHITSSLTELMRSTGTLIPLGPFLFEIFDSHELRSKGSPSTLKPPQFSTSIKVPNAYLGTRTYQIALVEETLHLLYEYHDALATSISFPEFSIPAIVKLKHFAKKSGNPQISKPVQQLVDKLSQNSKWVEQKRSNVDFSPKDEDKVVCDLIKQALPNL
ncbi:Noc2p family-domain-containing protein [Cladochytrium replicatum]|nr:Noc2p family-domain-containing protein [Cladochytrium replicatum]